VGVKVELTGEFLPDENVGPLFRSHSAIVMPYTQGFAAQSGVVFMALAYELPVIASEVGGLRDLFSEFKIGTTFAQYTPDALATAVQALHAGASASELLKHMRAAKDRFSWDVAAVATIAGYEATTATVKTTQAHDCRVATTPAC
jgi:glycosyltransferase involved in cell wall biosynthesis